MSKSIKPSDTIGCCGIDCGLCPRFYTNGKSACPGCGGDNFNEKHPSCGFLTCCAIKNRYETCAQCDSYPCTRFEQEKSGRDSFVTHKMVFTNLDEIKNHGLASFLELQKSRISLLEKLITKYDEGRSKSYYCLACALFPLEQIEELLLWIESDIINDDDLNSKAKKIRKYIQEKANEINIELKLNNKN